MFLPISWISPFQPHDGHPCLRLTLPATDRVMGFHHLVIAHAERTPKKSRRLHVCTIFIPQLIKCLNRFLEMHLNSWALFVLELLFYQLLIILKFLLCYIYNFAIKILLRFHICIIYKFTGKFKRL